MRNFVFHISHFDQNWFRFLLHHSPTHNRRGSDLLWRRGVHKERTNKEGKPFSLFVGFRETSWEIEYGRSIVEITRQSAIDNESALDR
ncbi:hypothetical protein ABTL28_19220, partial [Acinetobacter baumannii]